MNFSVRPRHDKAAFIFVFITVTLDMLAIGIIVPVLPKLILGFQGGDVAKAAIITGIFGTCWAAMQFIFSPILGSLSDRYGRRPIILLSNFGLGIDYIFMALAPSLSWLFIGRLISGMTSASISTAGAYITDVTAPEKRASRFGMLGAAFGLGFILGPALGGFLAEISVRMPFWVAGSLSLMNAVYGYFILPESLKVENQSPFLWKKANPLGALKLLKSTPILMGLSFAFFLNFFAHESLPGILVLYTHHRYEWTGATVGLFLAAIGLMRGMVSGVLVGPIVKKLGEHKTFVLGALSGIIGFCFYGGAPVQSLFFTGLPFIGFWGLSDPSLQSLITQKVSPKEQGQLQGSLSSLRSVSGMLGPLVYTQIFSRTVDLHESLIGIPYFLSALAILLSIIIFYFVTRQDPGKI